MQRSYVRTILLTAVACISVMVVMEASASGRELTDCDIYAASNFDAGRIGQGIEVDR